MPKVFIYKNPETFQKARQFVLRYIYIKRYTLRYAIFHEIFEVGIYIQKFHEKSRTVKCRDFYLYDVTEIVLLFEKFLDFCILYG